MSVFPSPAFQPPPTPLPSFQPPLSKRVDISKFHEILLRITWNGENKPICIHDAACMHAAAAADDDDNDGGGGGGSR